MGEAEIDIYKNTIVINAHIITYGNAADEKITEAIRAEIETMWNEPHGMLKIKGTSFLVSFRSTAALHPRIGMIDIYSNTNPRNNYSG